MCLILYTYVPLVWYLDSSHLLLRLFTSDLTVFLIVSLTSPLTLSPAGAFGNNRKRFPSADVSWFSSLTKKKTKENKKQKPEWSVTPTLPWCDPAPSPYSMHVVQTTDTRKPCCELGWGRERGRESWGWYRVCLVQCSVVSEDLAKRWVHELALHLRPPHLLGALFPSCPWTIVLSTWPGCCMKGLGPHLEGASWLFRLPHKGPQLEVLEETRLVFLLIKKMGETALRLIGNFPSIE